MSSELFISLNQKHELPPGYHQDHWHLLLQLGDRLEWLPELIIGIFPDDASSDPDTDDEAGLDARLIPADDHFPLSVAISATQLKHPELRAQAIDEIIVMFEDLMNQLPHLYLSFQSPTEVNDD
jgi:hypothetical protein